MKRKKEGKRNVKVGQDLRTRKDRGKRRKEGKRDVRIGKDLRRKRKNG